MLDKYGVPIYEEQMVEHLLNQSISPNTYLKIEVNICSSSHSSIFVKPSTYLSTVVVILYPSTNPSSGRFRKYGFYATGFYDLSSRSGGRFNVHGRGRGRVGGGGRFIGISSRVGHVGVSGTY